MSSKDSVAGDRKDEHNPFAIPAEEPEIAMLAQEPPAAVTSTPSVAIVTTDSPLTHVVREDERVA